jgi:hypothetical protein
MKKTPDFEELESVLTKDDTPSFASMPKVDWSKAKRIGPDRSITFFHTKEGVELPSLEPKILQNHFYAMASRRPNHPNVRSTFTHERLSAEEVADRCEELEKALRVDQERLRQQFATQGHLKTRMARLGIDVTELPDSAEYEECPACGGFVDVMGDDYIEGSGSVYCNVTCYNEEVQ